MNKKLLRKPLSSCRRRLPDIAGREAVLLKKIRDSSAVDGNGCWVWQKFRNRIGYGATSVRGVPIAAHRLAYLAAHGPFQSSLDICHTCDNRACVNPQHLWLGDRRANMRDAVNKGRIWNTGRNQCKYGHEYVTGSYRIRRIDGGKECKICERARQRRYWHEKPGLRERQLARRRAAKSAQARPSTGGRS